jgi:hypothetical protein
MLMEIIYNTALTMCAMVIAIAMIYLFLESKENEFYWLMICQYGPDNCMYHCDTVNVDILKWRVIKMEGD